MSKSFQNIQFGFLSYVYNESCICDKVIYIKKYFLKKIIINAYSWFWNWRSRLDWLVIECHCEVDGLNLKACDVRQGQGAWCHANCRWQSGVDPSKGTLEFSKKTIKRDRRGNLISSHVAAEWEDEHSTSHPTFTNRAQKHGGRERSYQDTARERESEQAATNQTIWEK